MSRAAKRHQKKLARKVALKQRRPSQKRSTAAAGAAGADELVALGEKANELQAAGDLTAAAEICNQILEIDARHADANHMLGILAQQSGDSVQAEKYIGRAIRRSPNRANFHNNLGNVLKDLDRHRDAVASYRKTLSIDPAFAAAHVNLGIVWQDLGQLDDAVRSFREALALEPCDGNAHRMMAHIRKHSDHDDDVRAMEEAYGRSDLDDDAKMHLAFGLGKAFEDLGQYQKAIEYFIAGNKLKRHGQGAGNFAAGDKPKGIRNLLGRLVGQNTVNMAQRELVLKKLGRAFDSALLDELADVGCQDETPIFIVGMPRSGTSLVEQILASHSQVFGAGELEIVPQLSHSFFKAYARKDLADDIRDSDRSSFERMGREYIDAIRKRARRSKFITDKNPMNFIEIGFIKLVLPCAKIIHCRREPADNCLSMFKSYFPKDGLAFTDDLDDLGRFYNLYGELMRHWHSVFPGTIYDIQYEELVADQEGQSRRLLEHCGLEWEDACLRFYETNRLVKTTSAEQVRRPIYSDSVQSWKRYEKQLAPLLKALR